MLQFQMPNITREQLAGNRARFEVEPLDRGFGHTFGNALRRVLLSSLEGAAVSSVKIEGVAHEFTTVKGVKEDVTDVILNLKELVCRLHGELDEVQVRLYKDKPGKVVAADIDIPAELEILNPDHHLATLSDGGAIEMTLTIRRGTGYVPAEGNKTPETVIGVVPIDSIFSPIKRVSYHVESARVGQRTDYDKLILEIWTDGRITPDDALKQSASILKHHLDVFDRVSEEHYEVESQQSTVSVEENKLRKLLNMSVNEIELSVRAANCLNNANITTVGELAMKTEQEMLKYRNFGKKSLNEIKEKLEALGLSLGMKFDERLLDTKKEI